MKGIYSAGDTNKLGNSTSLEDSMEGNSPEKEGGEVEFADGSIFEYDDRQDIIDIMRGFREKVRDDEGKVKKDAKGRELEIVSQKGVVDWTKRALMQLQDDGVLMKETALRSAGMLDYARAPRASGDLEFNNIMFSIDPNESAQLNSKPEEQRDAALRDIRCEFISAVNDFIQEKHPNDDKVKAAYFIVDHFHTDTPNFHVQARISRYSLHVDENKKPIYISKFDFDLTDSSTQKEFQKFISDRFGETIHVSYTGTSVEAAKAGETYKADQKVQQAVAQYTAEPVAPDLHKISRAEVEVASQLLDLDRQIQDLIDKRGEKQQALEDIKSSKTAIEEKLKAEAERDAANQELENVTAKLKDLEETVLPALQAEHQTAVDTIQDLNGKLEQALDNVDRAMTGMNQAVARASEIEEAKNELENQLQEIQEVTLPELETQLEEAERQAENYKYQAGQKDIELNSLKTENVTLNEEISRSEKIAARLKAQSDTLMKANEDLENLNVKANQRIAVQAQEIEKFEQANAQAKQHIADLESQLKAAQAEIAKERVDYEERLKNAVAKAEAETKAQAQAEKPAQAQAKSVFEAADTSKLRQAEERALDGYRAHKRQNGDVGYYNGLGQEAFTDKGNQIVVTLHDEASVKAALELAAKNFGDSEKGINIISNGDKQFEALVVKVAAENGITLKNKDLQSQVLAKLEEKDINDIEAKRHADKEPETEQPKKTSFADIWSKYGPAFQDFNKTFDEQKAKEEKDNQQSQNPSVDKDDDKEKE